ncbi:hypothetical protein B0H10DRAFT_1959055 [Mycena sp. CBHHK59/15]|nr:hypothetical protein B0H10DRAFT_1959055 [Mycena sp. CBHHK59/15]
MKPSTFSVLLSTLAVASASYLTSDSLPRGGPNQRRITPPNGPPQIPLLTNLTNAQLETAYAAQCAAVNSATGQSQILADIGNTTVNSIAIDVCPSFTLLSLFPAHVSQESFSQIYAQLLLIDSQNLNNGAFFAPTWNAINQNWTNILWASRTIASNTAAYCTEFTTTVMPFVANLTGPIPTNISVEVLKSYSDMADDLAAEAEATSEAFTDIINAMTDFTATFSRFAAEEDAMDQQMLDFLLDNIASLKQEIIQYNIEIVEAEILMGVTVFGSVVCMLLFPEAAPFIFLAGIAALGIEAAEWANLQNERTAALSFLDQNITQAAVLTNELAEIAQANYTLSQIQNSANAMGMQLQGFSAIWAAVKSDCNSVAEYITVLNSTIATIPQIFWSTENNIHCVYESVATALTDYAIGISDSGIPPPTSKRALEKFPAKLHADTQALVAAARAKANERSESDA